MSFDIAPYADSDAPGVAAFFQSAAAGDESLVPMDETPWRGFVARSFNDGGRDFAVARVDDELVGLLMSSRRDDSDGRPTRSVRAIVHPSYRGRGIGSAFAALVDTQDPAGDATVTGETLGAWKIGGAMFERRGFEVIERELWMSLPADLPRAAPDPPTGITLRTARAGDAAEAAAWQRVHHESFRHTQGYAALTEEDLESLRSVPRFHLWFAERDGDIVGFCHTDEFGDLSCVNALAVCASERGRGTGRALLAAGLRTLHEQAQDRVRLNVLVENTAAVTLYRSVGFETSDTITTWRRAPRGTVA